MDGLAVAQNLRAIAEAPGSDRTVRRRVAKLARELEIKIAEAPQRAPMSERGQKVSATMARRRAIERFQLRYEDGTTEEIVGWDALIERTDTKEGSLRTRFSIGGGWFRLNHRTRGTVLVIRPTYLQRHDLPGP